MASHESPASPALKDLVIGIKGAGEMATGLAWRLFQANFRHIIMMEIKDPVAVRRRVCFCEAVHNGLVRVEGVNAKKISSIEEIQSFWDDHCIPVMVDPHWEAIKALCPHVVIDAIIAKKNLGTTMADAPLVIGLGPGFEAGKDVHMVVETNRGHNLGRLILKGRPEPNTGVPGNINGFTGERVLRSPGPGAFQSCSSIGTPVKKDHVVGYVDTLPVKARIDGILRGLIRDNTRVTLGLKIGDIDPRGKPEYCSAISEKARAVGGSVLEAVLRTFNR
jgi:xanthine dehydrogenase accessory factor